ncbi:choice-of-anchor B family protein [Patiriisocius sp. Uisw_017]|jgi:choice-of-anchor B domain-containing protein|uniref:choice-of-anchor B family protein n=1 Tax=Patiriisocius sp. Uisw_017 TaxID=3230968 RepID=UPI0039EC3FA5
MLIAQTPCQNGFAGDYPCSGYDLLSEMAASEFGSNNANDSWGWTDPDTGSEYVLLGLDDGTAFINIDDPINPIYLGRLDTHTTSSIWRDVKTYNNYAFIVSEATGHGMQIFDLTRLRSVTSPPENFTEDAHYNGFGNAHNVVINENQGYAYGLGTSTYNGGPHFVDISEPLNPTAAGGYPLDFYSHDGQVVTYNGPDADYTGREIYIGSNESYISIVDITNKSNPIAISTATYPNTVYTHQGWFTEDQRYFLLGDEIDEINIGFETRTIIFDFSDLDDPQLHFEYSGPTFATDHNGYVKGDTYYLANYSAGVRMIDISDIENQNITETGFFDVLPANNTASYNGAWNIYPYFESGTLLISTLNFSDPSFIPGMVLIRSSSLGITDFEANEITIFPNPARSELSINGNNKLISKIELFENTGRLLFSKEINSLSTTIDVSKYAKGVFFLKINNAVVKKVILH